MRESVLYDTKPHTPLKVILKTGKSYFRFLKCCKRWLFWSGWWWWRDAPVAGRVRCARRSPGMGAVSNIGGAVQLGTQAYGLRVGLTQGQGGAHRAGLPLRLSRNSLARSRPQTPLRWEPWHPATTVTVSGRLPASLCPPRLFYSHLPLISDAKDSVFTLWWGERVPAGNSRNYPSGWGRRRAGRPHPLVTVSQAWRAWLPSWTPGARGFGAPDWGYGR